MGANSNGNDTVTDGRTTVQRTSDRDLVVTRAFDAPVHIVYAAWTRPELFIRWWAPKSFGVNLLSCDMDVRPGGQYRLEFGNDPGESQAFFGKYLEVVPNERLVWTNDEGPQGAVTTVSFEAKDGTTFLTHHERYPSKESLDEAFVGMEACMPEQFVQLDALLSAGDIDR